MRRLIPVFALLLLLATAVTTWPAVICTPLGQLTSVLQLCKPAAGETGWDAAMNNNLTVMDALFSGASLLKPLNGGTGVNGSVAANGTLLIGNGAGFALATLTGTSNQVTVTNGAGSATLSTPQNIDTVAMVQFGALGLGTTAGVAGTLKQTGKLILYNNAVPADGQLLIGGTAAGNFTAATLTAGSGITVTNSNNAVTVATATTPGGPVPVTALANSSAYAAVTNTTTETLFAIGADGTIPAGAINAAKHRIEVELAGIYSTTGTVGGDTLNIRIKLCTVSGCATGTVVTVAVTGVVNVGAVALTNQGWNARVVCNVYTAGAAGTIDCQGSPGATFFTSLTTQVIDDIVNTATSTIDTTVAEFLSVSAQWGAAAAANTITLRNFGTKVY